MRPSRLPALLAALPLVPPAAHAAPGGPPIEILTPAGGTTAFSGARR